MATAEDVVHQFTQALQSGDLNAITGLISGKLQHNLDRQGATTNLQASSTLGDASQRLKAANVKILDTIASGEQVSVRFQFDVNGKDVQGAKPGSKATVTAQCIAHVQNGKVVDASIEQDVAGMYLQLGLGIADAGRH